MPVVPAGLSVSVWKGSVVQFDGFLKGMGSSIDDYSPDKRREVMNILRRIVLVLSISILFSSSLFMGGNAQAEDAYEPNDTMGEAWHPGYNWVRTWLFSINGLGIQADEDWYRIDVDQGAERVQVDCRFTHADGDIDMALYDSTGTFLAESASVTDDEFIDYAVSSGGTYYVQVHYGNAGNTYDLRWDDLTEDIYEENDTLGTAWHPGYNWERTWLASINGFGIQADEDWYRIDVDQGAQRVQVDCSFFHAEGDINIALYDSAGSLLAESNSVTDDEFIDYAISSGGKHYIRVHYGNAGTMYDLWWDDLNEDAYEENDAFVMAWHPGYNWVRKWLSSINGFGIQADEDWYRIDVDQGAERVQVDCWFTHAEGDIDIALYDSTGTLLLAESTSVTDGEFINYTISSGGIYNVQVHYGDAGNAYDLRWDDFSSGDPSLTALDSDFGIAGLYQYDGSSWSRLTSSNPEYLAAYGGKMTGDFGVAGLYEFDGASWFQLTSSDADNSGNCMVAYGTSLVVDFGGLGLWQYDGGSWSRLTLSNPQYLAVYGSKLVGDFGVAGLWEFDGTAWSQLTSSDPDNAGNCMVAYGMSLVVDFGALGLYRYVGGSWSRLTSSNPQYLAVYGSKLVGDFGVAGLWEFDGASWSQLTSSDADNSGNCLVAYGTSLIGDFGVAGLYQYDGSSWSRLTSSNPQYLAVYGNKLVGDFGSAGLYEFDGTFWSQLTSSDADNNGNCMVGVDFM
jgi:hypothetical protein